MGDGRTAGLPVARDAFALGLPLRCGAACGFGPVVHGSRTVYGWPYGGAVALGGAGVLVGARGRG